MMSRGPLSIFTLEEPRSECRCGFGWCAVHGTDHYPPGAEEVAAMAADLARPLFSHGTGGGRRVSAYDEVA